MNPEARRVAREAKNTPALRFAARAGYAANGLVHILIGVIVLVVAFGGDGETDQAGAFKAIAAAPLGFAVLWILAVALWALGVWHVLEGVLARPTTTSAPDAIDSVVSDDTVEKASKWGVRVSEFGQAVVFIALGVVAASVALGAQPDGDTAAQDASRGVLGIPGGVFLLGAVGVGVAIGGIAFVVMGGMRSFEKKMSIPSGALGDGVKVLGIVGFIAKGIALLILGILLLVAAIKVDPDAAGGLDAAVSALIALPYGPWLASAVGVGLIVYGVFCVFRARYARL
ncbi:DUF1206 domain-containing protein [Microbacterium aoyamense]|uniref:DUF1206 domain-containing protein n=1 Tax=Microbacterium aoyamense TaxID=344166 RepID=A0ABP5B8Q9_9MICO|nr:DUF1206 domain-containing protein [Microbacterium aoyamense]